MAWHGSLDLDFRLQRFDGTPRTVGRASHEGPLRVLRSLYPEDPAVCHQVLVHPPGGIVGGDTLRLDVRLDVGAHALLTTPGATRFYRSAGATARQSLEARCGPGSRLEWLPLETLVHDGARAVNTLRFALEAGAETIGWDLLCLGMPVSGETYTRGRFEQRVEVIAASGPAWLERGVLDFDDPRHAERTRRLLASPLGWDDHPVLGTLWFAAGAPLEERRREHLLEAARAALPEALAGGATAPHPNVIVVRALARRVEPLAEGLGAVRAAWRRGAWHLEATLPRVWRT